jgi:hypothetical protein
VPVEWSIDDPTVASLDPTAGTTDENGETTTTATPPDDSPTLDTPTTVRAVAQGAEGTAQLTVEPSTSEPVATDDDYGTSENTALNVSAGDGLLSNDDVGNPPGTIASFGGGSLGGDVSSNPRGLPVNFGTGGSLVVNGNGSFDFTPSTDFSGLFTFEYRVQNTVGFDDGLVTIAVSMPPQAVDDGPAASSAPGDDFHTALNTALVAADGSSQDLLNNDMLGFPFGDIVSFGGGHLGGTVDDNPVGSPVGGCSGDCTVQVDANGAFTFTPSNDITGLFTFEYKLANAEGSSSATVAVAVGVRAEAVDDSRDVTGNVSINTATIPFSVLDNDVGNGITITNVNDAGTQGTVTMNLATGEFTFDAAAGFEGATTFDYEITNGLGSATATVTLTVADMIWFIDNTAGPGDGRLSSPFNSLAAFGAANGGGGANDPEAGEHIFLYESGTAYNGPVTLLNNQRLIGQDATSSLETLTEITLAPGSVALPTMNSGDPTARITSSSADGVVLGQDNRIHGLTVGNTSGIGIKGNGFGTLTVSDVDVKGSGQALGLSTGSVTATFGELSSSSSSGQGIDLEKVDGTLSHTAASAIANANGTAFRVGGGGVVVTYNGTITNTVALAAWVGFRSTGAVTFGGAVSDVNAGGVFLQGNSSNVSFTSTVDITNSAAAAGLRLSGNTGGTFSFADLDIDNSTSNQPGISAASNLGATLSISTGSINAGSGTGVDIASTDLNVTFSSINAGGGLIFHSNTGSFTSSGGTVTATSGSTVSIDGGAATYNLNDMTISRTGGRVLTVGGAAGAGGTINFGGTSTLSSSGGDFGMKIDNSGADITIASVSISNTVLSTQETRNGAGFPTNDGSGDGIFLDNNTGSFTVSGGTITNTDGEGIDFRNSRNLTLNNLTIDGVATSPPGSGFSAGLRAINSAGFNAITGGAIQNFDTAPNPMGLLVLSNNANSTWIIDGVAFDEKPGGAGSNATAGIQMAGQGSASVTITVRNGTTFQNIFGDGFLVTASNPGWNGTHDINVSGSTFGPPPLGGGTGLQIDAIGSGTYDIDIDDNAFNTTGTGVGRAINLSFANSATMLGSVTGNVINPAERTGIEIIVDDQASADLVIDGNDIQNGQRDGIFIRARDDVKMAEFEITNNQIGVTGGVAREGIVLDLDDNVPLVAATLNVLIDGNTINVTDLNRQAIEIDVDDAVDASITVTNNTLTSEASTNTFDIDTGSNGSPMICLDLRNNSVSAGAGYFLNRDNGTFHVEGPTTNLVTAADIQAQNNSGAASVTGTINFNNNTNCTLPSP